MPDDAQSGAGSNAVKARRGPLAAAAGRRADAWIPKSGNRFPAFAKPASAGEAKSDKIVLRQAGIDGLI
jgi:hypothetical protein